MIVTVTPQDYGGTGVLAGMEFQRRLEEAAYRLGKGRIPVQLFEDFAEQAIERPGRHSSTNEGGPMPGATSERYSRRNYPLGFWKEGNPVV